MGFPAKSSSQGRHSADSKVSKRNRVNRFLARFIVFFAAGLLFAGSATLRTPEVTRHDSDLLSLVSRKEASVESLKQQTNDINAQIEELLKSIPGESAAADERSKTNFEGPGLTVTLTDAPVPEPLPEGITPDDLVIHQQDIEAVFNALWAGGAEVVGIQGHQVRSDSTVSCVGNVININGQLYSPPYEISAIGPTEQMRQTLFSDPQINIIQGYVARLGLGFKVKDASEIVIRGAKQKPDFTYVKVTE